MTVAPTVQTVTYTIDPMHSSARFTIRHFMISNVHGEFTKVTGSVVYDPSDPSKTTVQAVIDANSFNSGQPQRDEHVKAAEFLNVAEYPVITYTSSAVETVGSQLRLTGDLSLHGVTKEVVLDVEGPTEEIKDPWGNLRVGVHATTEILRSDFGLHWNAPLETGGFALSDHVKIMLELELIKQS